MIGKLKEIIGKKIIRLFLIVWPPYRESDISKIDISVGIVFEKSSNELVMISTDKNDLTAPIVEHLTIPKKYFDGKDFDWRMKSWIFGEEMEIDTEYYEVTAVDVFQNIVNEKILDVELVGIKNRLPFGIKLIFGSDFILSTPLSDGNTIETSCFNKNENLKNFEKLGEIEFISVNP